ncbi:fused MFS/spermidine synthase [Ancylothrix sp. C2]|uniref:fused MFS/spermidine synthase n=1 Tax=Ancylothrix sp. D3o TaxID=2953691 RepID=UPI0021BA4CFD|nr:fused MFS/spermidine synthase [Ancylothrix sp. D3o]MCT7950345.1 fused MFS/spermidine synthase [Ancylothrix sp. D3o]
MMLIIFSATLFISAFLLFWVQLMVAKMILPLLGGSPSVWNTCQLFFQAVLLLGYGYSHLTTQRWGLRRQAIFHSFLLFLPVAFLPLTLTKYWLPPQNANPIFWLLALLLVSVGLPFFVISTTAPLMQKWFASTPNSSQNDPYFLYSASNLGSMLGLLFYPIFIEPNFSLSQQSWAWSAGYGLLIFLTLCCAGFLAKKKFKPTKGEMPVYPPADATPGELPLQTEAGESLDPPTLKQQLQWLFLAFIPSSLLLGITTYLTVDLAAIPLLWAVPLALYLLTFILAFAPTNLLPIPIFSKSLPLFFSPLIILSLLKILQPIGLLLPLHLTGFFIATGLFHAKLAQLRPPVQYLTKFYLWVAFGGVLGGIFNALLAPAIFPTISEYPLIMLLSLLLLQTPLFPKNNPKSKILPLSLGLLLGALLGGFTLDNFFKNALVFACGVALLAAIYYIFTLSKWRFVAGALLILMLAQFSIGNLGGLLYSERSFFGVNRVVYDKRGNYHSLLHGTTLHGRQSLDPKRQQEPLTYFHPTGPIGQLFQYLNSQQKLKNIAVLGLGIGTLAAYSQPGQNWTFYEIDPSVKKIASDPRYFTFLKNAKSPYQIILGDARLKIAEVGKNSYDLIVMDAFSSDSIPVHLITKEALELYSTKLAKNGIIAVNISNRYLNVEPVLAALAENLNFAALRQLQKEMSPAEKEMGKSASHWVIFAQNREDFGKLTADSRWQTLPKTKNAPLWTDEYSNIFSLLRF